MALEERRVPPARRLWALAAAAVLGTLFMPPRLDAQIRAPGGLAYPAAPRGNQVDVLHGTRVPDPYRWLEDIDSAETRRWVEAENRLTQEYLAGLPSRAPLERRLTQLWNYERYGTPAREGGRLFFTRNDGLQNQAVLYVAESLEGTPRVLLDPNTLSKDGTVALSGTAASENGKLLAYGVSAAGSDWQEWRVRDVDTGRDLPDLVRWVKFSHAEWTKDSKGFFYSRYEEPQPGRELAAQNYYMQLYYHRVGTPQAQDALVYERRDQKEWGFDSTVSEDGRYLVINVWQGSDPKNRLFYKDLKDAANPAVLPDQSPVVELRREADAIWTFVGNDGRLFWLLTDKGAPRQRVVGIDLRRPDLLREVVPEALETLENVTVVGDRFLCSYLKDARAQVKAFSLAGEFQREIAMPGIGTASGFGGKRIERDTFYQFTGFTSPAAVYRLDVASGKSSVFRQPKVAFDPSRFETKQVFYPSKDGTRIPMFITCKKGLTLNGDNPTYLYGYGGFRSAMTPYFSVSNTVWMEMGGVFALANLRGGGEYGQAWHDAGRRDKKQNVFDDFIAAAEWLIGNRYTSTKRLAIGGDSNGGLLVGACITQRPDLYAAALPGVGVMDMLRFHKFTIGWAWVSDYGSPDDPHDFKTLYAYSPFHNIKPGTAYPATLVTTGDHDDRVFPAHSFKFAAALQAAQAGPAPVLIRIETRAGHGAGKPTSKIIAEIADRWAFLARALDVQVPASFESPG